MISQNSSSRHDLSGCQYHEGIVYSSPAFLAGLTYRSAEDGEMLWILSLMEWKLTVCTYACRRSYRSVLCTARGSVQCCAHDIYRYRSTQRIDNGRRLREILHIAIA